MKTLFNENGDRVFEFDGCAIVADNTADYEYRSHINGMRCTCPENWVSMHGVDSNGNDYTIWYRVSDEPIALDDIDYDSPTDITNEYGHIIWDSEK